MDVRWVVAPEVAGSSPVLPTMKRRWMNSKLRGKKFFRDRWMLAFAMGYEDYPHQSKVLRALLPYRQGVAVKRLVTKQTR